MRRGNAWVERVPGALCVRPRSRVYPLEQLYQAHEHLERGHVRGRVVVSIRKEEAVRE